MLFVSTQAKIAEYLENITLDMQKLHAILASKFTIATLGLFSTYSAKGLRMTHRKLTWKKENESFINNCPVLYQTQLHLRKTQDPLWTSADSIYTTLKKQKLIWAFSKLLFLTYFYRDHHHATEQPDVESHLQDAQSRPIAMKPLSHLKEWLVITV